MPNDDCIKRSDAFKWVCERCIEGEECQNVADPCFVEVSINKIPAADVVPVRHGRWIKSPECPEEYDICSVCGLNDKHRTRADQEHPAFESLPLYCKWCGAKMDKEKDDD